MKLAIIVAAAKNGVIGINNQLPWHLPQDLKYFKSVTMGKPVIMGRKTYESIGRPLPGRMNIVITRDESWNTSADVVVVHTLKAAVDAAKSQVDMQSNFDEAIIIGGAQIYKEALSLVDRVYLTEVDLEPEGDAFFAPLDQRVWMCESATRGDASASVQHQFLIYRRKAE